MRTGDDLRTAFELMRAEGIRELPVVDDAGFLVGLVAEADIAQAYLRGERPEVGPERGAMIRLQASWIFIHPARATCASFGRQCR